MRLSRSILLLIIFFYIVVIGIFFNIDINGSYEELCFEVSGNSSFVEERSWVWYVIGRNETSQEIIKKFNLALKKNRLTELNKDIKIKEGNRIRLYIQNQYK